MRNPTLGKKILIIACALLLLAAILLVVVLVARVDATQAQQAALEATGGGEIIRREISREGLLSEYSYVIVNGDSWYEVEISGFGNVTELEQGTGTYRD